MRHRFGSMVVVAALMGLASTAWAQSCPCEGPPGGPGMGRWDGASGPGFGAGPGAMAQCLLDSRDLDLSADQRKTIESILDTARDEGRKFRDEARDLKDQFLKTFSDPKVSADQVRDMARAMRKHHEDLADRRLEVLLKVRAVLTPEQLKKVPDAVDACRPGPGRRHRRGR